MSDDVAAAWLEKKEDEAVLSLIVAANGPWSMAAYHIQQSAEKHIKAVLSHLGVAPPKSHDLVFLLSLSSASCPSKVYEAAEVLTTFAWLTRYPGSPVFHAEQISSAREDLRVITEWAQKNLT